MLVLLENRQTFNKIYPIQLGLQKKKKGKIMSLNMLPIDGLVHIENGLRTAPRKLTAGGVVVVEILSDSVSNWCEFLRELILASQPEAQPNTDLVNDAGQ